MEPEIAPLAKRLAEENNVNWRALTGSGANGRILERDVLEYLARVMAGEEDLNPTSEPLPEGLDAWPEDDVKSYYGVDTLAETPDFTPDIEDTSLFVDAAEPALVTQDTIGEDIFLVDEEDLSVAPTSSHEAVVYDSSLNNLDDDMSDVYGALTLDDMGVGGSLDLDGEMEAFTQDAPSLESFEPVVEETIEDLSVEPMLDSFEEPAQVIADSFNQQDFSDTASLFVEESAPVEEAFAALVSEPIEDSFNDISALEEAAEFVGTSSVSDDIFADPEMISASYDSIISDENTSENVFVDEVTVQDTFVEDVVSQDIFVEETSSAEIPVATEWQEPEVAAATWSEPEYIAESSEVLAPVTMVGAGIALGATQGTSFSQLSASTLPLVTYGVLLRRHIDLSTLIQAQHAVAEEFGREDPMVMTCFLLRAAAKALHKVPLVQGSVGVASIREQGVGMMAMPEASSAPFRTVLDKTHQALDGSLQQDAVVLAIADMSGFDIDEAVLNVGVPVLTLGRMMYDNGKGTHHSTLSISGNVSVESGTKFLSAVAELLNSPVRLVV